MVPALWASRVGLPLPAPHGSGHPHGAPHAPLPTVDPPLGFTQADAGSRAGLLPHLPSRAVAVRTLRLEDGGGLPPRPLTYPVTAGAVWGQGSLLGAPAGAACGGGGVAGGAAAAFACTVGAGGGGGGGGAGLGLGLGLPRGPVGAHSTAFLPRDLADVAWRAFQALVLQTAQLVEGGGGGVEPLPHQVLSHGSPGGGRGGGGGRGVGGAGGKAPAPTSGTAAASAPASVTASATASVNTTSFAALFGGGPVASVRLGEAVEALWGGDATPGVGWALSPSGGAPDPGPNASGSFDLGASAGLGGSMGAVSTSAVRFSPSHWNASVGSAPALVSRQLFPTSPPQGGQGLEDSVAVDGGCSRVIGWGGGWAGRLVWVQ